MVSYASSCGVCSAGLDEELSALDEVIAAPTPKPKKAAAEKPVAKEKAPKQEAEAVKKPVSKAPKQAAKSTAATADSGAAAKAAAAKNAASADVDEDDEEDDFEVCYLTMSVPQSSHALDLWLMTKATPVQPWGSRPKPPI